MEFWCQARIYQARIYPVAKSQKLMASEANCVPICYKGLASTLRSFKRNLHFLRFCAKKHTVIYYDS